MSWPPDPDCFPLEHLRASREDKLLQERERDGVEAARRAGGVVCTARQVSTATPTTDRMASVVLIGR